MTDSIYTGGTTSDGPIVSANSTAAVNTTEFDYGIQLPQYNNIPSSNGVFSGTLSAQGNMIAMLMNPGGPKIVVVTGGPKDEFGNDLGYAVPWLTGYLREYWKNPSLCTFGSNSAIPALTGVMPADRTLQGSALYYMDLQLTRVAGSNYFDNFKFINTFNVSLNWASSSNDYILALQKSENNNLSYYGYDTYQAFLTSGFSNYKVGLALTKALTNIGSMVTEISKGQFGTVNSVAKVLVDLGLGSLGGLSAKLTGAGIPIDDNLYNSIYTAQIEEILKTIDKVADLETIQAVIGSTIPNMKDPTYYTSIELCSGLVNDSLFKSFREFGIDLYQKSPEFSLTTGENLAAAINFVLSESSESLESLATTTSILPPEIIDGLREFLPKGVDNGQVSILNIIGTPSGYLTEYLSAVNSGLDLLDKSAYGTQIRNAFKQLNDTYLAYTGSLSGDENSPPPPPSAVLNFENAKKNYAQLLNTISADPTTANIVENINSNYNQMCLLLDLEVQNYNKANATINGTIVRDNSIIYSFVNSLPSYASDTQGLGTDFMLYNMCQDNQAGDLVKSVMNQYKNKTLFSSIGVKDSSII